MTPVQNFIVLATDCSTHAAVGPDCLANLFHGLAYLLNASIALSPLLNNLPETISMRLSCLGSALLIKHCASTIQRQLAHHDCSEAKHWWAQNLQTACTPQVWKACYSAVS